MVEPGDSPEPPADGAAGDLAPERHRNGLDAGTIRAIEAIVMVAVAEPVRAGLVASLARPGGNITGSTLLAGIEMVGKHLELLKAAVPNLARVAVLSNPANPMHALRLDRAAAARIR